MSIELPPEQSQDQNSYQALTREEITIAFKELQNEGRSMPLTAPTSLSSLFVIGSADGEKPRRASAPFSQQMNKNRLTVGGNDGSVRKYSSPEVRSSSSASSSHGGSAAAASSKDGPMNLSSLQNMLRCVGCEEILFPPIVQCLAGHMACKNCALGDSECAKCGKRIVQVPAKLAEAITEQFRVKCSHASLGCLEFVTFKVRADHEELCPFKPVQCPEFDCGVAKPLNEIFKHFRSEHQHHFVNAHGSSFNGDIRCDDSNMVMGVERKWAPTMMKLNAGPSDAGDAVESVNNCTTNNKHYFFLEIMRTQNGAWHMWIWFLGEREEAKNFHCEISIRGKKSDGSPELKYSGCLHSIRVTPHRVVLTGCLLSFSDCTAAYFRRSSGGGHWVIDYKVSVAEVKKPSGSDKTGATISAAAAKMLRRFSADSTAANFLSSRPNKTIIGAVIDEPY